MNVDKSKIEAARAALQHMDDFAMMSCAVDPVGPRGVLEQFISEVERLRSLHEDAGVRAALIAKGWTPPREPDSCCGDPGDCAKPCETATRPTQKAPCPDCGACWTGPHACGKPGIHGEPEPAEEGWIEWKGGKRPVAEGTVVQCRYRNGHVSSTAAAEGFRWEHATSLTGYLSPAYDIVAYRLHRPS